MWKVPVRSPSIIEYVESFVMSRGDIPDIDEYLMASQKRNATLMFYDYSFINVILLNMNVYIF